MKKIISTLLLMIFPLSCMSIIETWAIERDKNLDLFLTLYALSLTRKSPYYQSVFYFYPVPMLSPYALHSNLLFYKNIQDTLDYYGEELLRIYRQQILRDELRHVDMMEILSRQLSETNHQRKMEKIDKETALLINLTIGLQLLEEQRQKEFKAKYGEKALNMKLELEEKYRNYSSMIIEASQSQEISPIYLQKISWMKFEFDRLYKDYSWLLKGNQQIIKTTEEIDWINKSSDINYMPDQEISKLKDSVDQLFNYFLRRFAKEEASRLKKKE